jgi:hypothetical protein
MSDIAPARTIVVRAQHAVDQWNADRTRPDFAGAIEAAVGLHWTPDPANAAERDAFSQVAHAIHRGEGQITTNPMHLLRIARRVLET